MLPHLSKGFGIFPATNAFVIFQDSLSKSGRAEFDVAGDGEFGQLVREIVYLPAPIDVFRLRHNLVIEIKVVLPARHAQQDLAHDGDVVPVV